MTLLVSGCSFSETQGPQSWALVTSEALGWSLTNVASGSMGNGLISRRLLYALERKLAAGIRPYVCVMWSGMSRMETLASTHPAYTTAVTQNPIGIDSRDADPRWSIHNAFWTDAQSQLVYRAYDSAHMQFLTLEHILHTQWRLQSLGIRYLFMQYKKETFLPLDQMLPDHMWLYDQIDWQRWIRKPCFEWALDQADLTLAPDGTHPSQDHYQRWAEQQVIPWIQRDLAGT